MVNTYRAYSTYGNPTLKTSSDGLSSNNFYGSTQSRLKKYTVDRRIEEHNGEVQQAKVYQRLAEERGDVDSADRLAKLATMVINKFGQQVQAHTIDTNAPIEQQPFDLRSYLKQAIQSGTLSQLWDRMKKVPDSQLSKKAQIIKSDIKNSKMLMDILNEKLHDAVVISKGQSGLTEAQSIKQGKLLDYTVPKINVVVNDIIQTIAGSEENESAVEELVSKSNATIAENVQKQLALQTKKFGPRSTSSSNDATEVGTEMGNPRMGAPVQFPTAESYIQHHRDEAVKLPNLYDANKFNGLRAYLRSNFGYSVDRAQEVFPTKK